MTSSDSTEAPSLIRTLTDRPERLYAVGDIHGCLPELATLLDFLRDNQGLSQNDQVIFIGDYVDRGVSSKDVIDLLVDFKGAFPKTVFLKGNHEEMMLSFLGLGGEGGEMYLHNGGLQTFSSYGIPPFADKPNAVSAIPPEHLAFFQSLDTGVSLAEFLFVHAGVDPRKKLAQQTTQDLLWIRQAFTEATHPFGITVVFGHTPFEDVCLDLPYKVGIDTGLVYGNRLTCVELVEGDLLQVEAGETDVKVASLGERISST